MTLCDMSRAVTRQPLPTFDIINMFDYMWLSSNVSRFEPKDASYVAEALIKFPCATAVYHIWKNKKLAVRSCKLILNYRNIPLSLA